MPDIHRHKAHCMHILTYLAGTVKNNVQVYSYIFPAINITSLLDVETFDFRQVIEHIFVRFCSMCKHF